MKLIAVEPGYYGTARIRIGQEFDWTPRHDGDKPPSWSVPATPEERLRLADEAKVKERRNFEALVASAGPKRNGLGARRVNTGLADATAEPERPKAVSRYGNFATKNEADIAGVDPVVVPGSDELA